MGLILTWDQGRMPKRKVESPPEIVERPAATEDELTPNQGLPITESNPTSDRPTGEESPKEPTEGHLSPARDGLDEGSAPGWVSFWDLMSLAGYETWGE